MLSKQHIENFLRLNDVPLTAPENQIRAALRSAHWAEPDIDIAIALLRGLEEELDMHRNVVAKDMFYTDTPIAPDTLSSLLGIDIVLLQKNLAQRRIAHEQIGRAHV